jgi:dTMP kinase
LARVRASRSVDRLEVEALAFHERLRAGYLELAAAEPGRFVVIDAMQPPERVQRAMREALAGRLGVEMRTVL